MRAKPLAFFFVLGACSTTGQQVPVNEAKPAVTLPVVVQDSSKVPASVPKTSDTNVTPALPSQDFADFAAWKANFVDKARARGFEPVFVESVLANVVVSKSVISADASQPEFSKPISSYVKGAISPARVSNARSRLDANVNVLTIEDRYGVPSSILGGIWAMESDMGRVQGDIDVVTALASLAYNGRRRVWAEDQLLATLTILRSKKATRDMLKGSWAGAMGQTQFLPDNYLKIAQDGDNDGIVDIWKSESDALASAANLLKVNGWVAGQSWAVEVTLPAGFDFYLAETKKAKPTEWSALGVKRADGHYWSSKDIEAEATLILPSGANGPAFLAFPNHFVIRKYNNSTAYALAVGLLADSIAGNGVLTTPWPEEAPLNKTQRFGAQTALKSLGFDPGAVDGIIGVGTRSALREWQKSVGRTADGYLSAALADELIMISGQK